MRTIQGFKVSLAVGPWGTMLYLSQNVFFGAQKKQGCVIAWLRLWSSISDIFWSILGIKSKLFKKRVTWPAHWPIRNECWRRQHAAPQLSALQMIQVEQLIWRRHTLVRHSRLYKIRYIFAYRWLSLKESLIVLKWRNAELTKIRPIFTR